MTVFEPRYSFERRGGRTGVRKATGGCWRDTKRSRRDATGGGGWGEPAMSAPHPYVLDETDNSPQFYRRKAGVDVDMKRLQDALGRGRLEELRVIVRALTYGEMMELVEAVEKIEVPPGMNKLAMQLNTWARSNEQAEV